MNRVVPREELMAAALWPRAKQKVSQACITDLSRRARGEPGHAAKKVDAKQRGEFLQLNRVKLTDLKVAAKHNASQKCAAAGAERGVRARPVAVAAPIACPPGGGPPRAGPRARWGRRVWRPDRGTRRAPAARRPLRRDARGRARAA